MEIRSLIAALADGGRLTADQSRDAFGILMSGEATPSQIGAVLMALRVRGETVPEIVGAVQAMRERMTRVDAPAGAIDIVGTGGDASGSYNVSTCAAIVAAAAGATVAKHGNRALSSRSGAADTLEALGVDIELEAQRIGQCIAEVGLGFMFAPTHHSAVRHVGPSRKELGTRTIFNLLGPLSNPAGAKHQVVGVFSEAWVEPLAEVLRELGCEHAWVVHGDGLDEITVTGPTKVAELTDGSIRTFEITPGQVDLAEHDIEALKGGDAHENADALRRVLDGEPSAYRDIVLMNAAAGLVVGRIASDLRDGVVRAAEAIDGGSAKRKLADLVVVSNQ